MTAEHFIPSQQPYYYTKIVNLISHSYNELKAHRVKSKYNRKDLLNQHIAKKGKPGKKTKLELEDYLRNELVTSYINKYKFNFELEYFHFVAGPDEIQDNITTGHLDIKVIIPSIEFSEDEPYHAIECKRINKSSSTKDYYIAQGLNRFITRQYYPTTTTNVATMLVFMEADKQTNVEDITSLVGSLNKIISASTDPIYKIVMPLEEKNAHFTLHDGVNIFNSSFTRTDNTPISIYHLFLDYYNLFDS
ncbi:hypothetical protein D3C87_02560 [compost metagenome]